MSNVVIRFDKDDEGDEEYIPPEPVKKDKQIKLEPVDEIVVEKGDAVVVPPEDLIEPLKILKNMGVPSHYLYYVNQRKNYFFLGIGVILILIFIAIVVAAVYVYLTYFATPNSFDYDSMKYNTTQYQTTPIYIDPGTTWRGVIENIDHPQGNSAIHAIYLSLLDSQGGAFPIEKVYPISISFIIDNNVIGMVQGGSPNLFKLPIPSAIQSNEGSKWDIKGEIANLFGFVTEAEIGVYINYTIVYSAFDSNTTTPVLYYILGGTPLQTTQINGGSSFDGSTTEVTFSYTWDNDNMVIVVESAPIISVGAVNSTLSAGNITISSSSITYSDSGYISSVDIDYPGVTLSSGTGLQVTTVYYEYDFPSVTSTFGIYALDATVTVDDYSPQNK